MRPGTSPRTPLLLGVTTSVALLLAACGGGGGSTSAAGSAPAAKQDIVVARAHDVTTLDADSVAKSQEGWETLSLIADPLFAISATGAIEPRVAASHVYSADHQTLTITLRDGAAFSNGTPVTSADVKFSIENAKTGPLQGELFAPIDSIATPDQRTVVLHYETAGSDALLNLSSYAVSIIPANFGGRSKEDFWKEPIGAGPFKLAQWTQGKDIKLVRNDSYYGAKPKLTSIDFVTVPDENTRLLQLENGSAALIDGISPAQVRAVEGKKTLAVKEFASAEDVFLTLNTAAAPFDDLHARRAVSLAINRDDIVKAGLQGHGRPGGSFIVPSAVGGHTPSFGAKSDLNEARAELAKSRTPGGFPFTLIYRADSSSATVAAVQIVKQQLAPLGIEVSLESVDANALQARIKAGNWGADVATIVADTDAGAVLQYYGATNGFYAGEKSVMDQIAADYAKANADFSGQDARIAIFRKSVDTVAESAVQIALFDTTRMWAARSTVADLGALNPTGAVDFGKVYLTS